MNAERLVLLSWSRAILLQFAHPLIAAGVHDHSGFRATPWAAAVRLRQTVRAMLALTFGDEAARAGALDAIRAIHRRVHGRLPAPTGPFPAGTRYSAEDPDLVLWVHATLLESVPVFYELLVAPLTMSERDAYCEESAPVAVALGAREADVPRSWRAARAHVVRVHASGVLVVSPQARELAAAVLSPRMAGLTAPLAWTNRLLTVGLLPPAIREQYGFQWSRANERALARLVMGLRQVRRVLPERLATWPASTPSRRATAPPPWR